MEGDFGAALHLERNSEIMTAALLAFSASVLLGPYGKKTIMFGAAICKRNVSLMAPHVHMQEKWNICSSIRCSSLGRRILERNLSFNLVLVSCCQVTCTAAQLRVQRGSFPFVFACYHVRCCQLSLIWKQIYFGAATGTLKWWNLTILFFDLPNQQDHK